MDTNETTSIQRLVQSQDEQHIDRMTEYAAMALKEVNIRFIPGSRAYDKLRDAIDTLLS